MRQVFFSKPVIASSSGGLPEIVHDGKGGFLVPPNNPIALKNALEVFINDPSLIKTMGISHRESVISKFDMDNMAFRLETLFY